MTDLLSQKCIPCEGGTPPLTPQEVQTYHEQTPSWTVSNDLKKIAKSFKCRNFQESLDFANRIGELAEHEGHHPALEVEWGRLGVTLTTHAVKGLSPNDFILAAKIDALTQK